MSTQQLVPQQGTVLIVDDTPASLRLLSRILTKQGYQVRAATSGDQALQSAQNTLPDLILLDIVMPGMDGYEVCSHLKANERIRDIPIIFVSALGSMEDKINAFAAGGVDFITKPFHTEEVLVRVQTHLTLRHIQRQLEDKNRQLEQEAIERNRAEHALRKSEERLELALEGAGEGMWDLETQTGRLYLSPRSCAMLGFEPNEVEPSVQWWVDRIHPQDVARVDLVVEEHLQGRTPRYEAEYRVGTKSGEWRWILDRGKAVERDEQGRPLREIGIHLDITERKRAEEALARRAAFERLISEISSDLVGLNAGEVNAGIDRALAAIGTFAGVDRAYVFQFRSDGARMDNTHEWCAEGIEPQIEHLQDIVLAEELPWFAERIRRAELFHVPDVAALPDEAQLDREHFEAQGIQSLLVVPMVLAERLMGFLGFDTVRERRLWTDDDQALLRLVGETFANALERSRAETLLQENQALLDLFFTQSLDGFFITMLDEPVRWDDTVDKTQVLDYAFAHQRFTRANNAMLAQHGMTREQFLGRTLADYFAHDSARAKGRLRHLYDTGHLHMEADERKFDGTPMWIESNHVCLYDAQGRITGGFGVQHDVTEQRRMVRMLQDQERFLSALNDVTRAALESSDIQDMLQVLADRMGELFETDGCYLTLWDEATQRTVTGAAYGVWRDRYRAVTPEPGEVTVTESVLHVGHPLAIKDVYDSPYLGKNIAKMLPDRSLLGLPLVADGRKLGAALIAYKDTHHFTENEIARGEQAAGQIALAMAKALALQAEQEQRGRVEALNKKLESSEERYRTVSQLTSDFATAYRFEPDGRATIEWLSGAFERITGLTREQVVAQGGISSIVHPDDVVGIQTLLQSLRENRPAEGDFRIVDQSGEVRWLHGYTYPDWDEVAKRPRGFYLAARDITERKRAETALRESEERYRTFFGSINDAVMVHPFREKGFAPFIEVNDVACERYGYSRDEFLQLLPTDITYRADVERHVVPDQRMQLLETGHLFFEAVHIKKSGETFPVEINSSIIERYGQPVVLAVVRDITERKQAEERLQEANTIINNSSTVAVTWRNQAGWPVEYISENVHKIFGYTAQEFVSGAVEYIHCIHPDDLERVAREVEDSSKEKGRTEFVHEPYRIITKEGLEKVIADWTFVVRDADGEITHYKGLLEDITARKRAQEALIQASRLEATATLAGGIAHDFNNLMVGVLGYADLLKTELQGQVDGSQWSDTEMMLDTVSESARKANVLAQQMLAFARGGKYQPQEIDLNGAVQRVVSTWGRTLPGRIQLVQEMTPDLWPIRADPTQIGQVILNLLINAAEAIEGGGQITVATSSCALSEADLAQKKSHCSDLAPGDYVCLLIRDTGCGMSAEVQARAFEPFFTTKFQGRGMGLAAAYGIVDNHDGCITIDSREGQGATVQVWLPAISVTIAEPPKPERLIEPPVLVRPATVLVVEDDPPVRQLIVRVVRRLGYDALAAGNGREAMDIARSFDGEIHLAILDMSMPEMGGSETYPLLVGARPEIKVILCSGYEMDDAAQALLDAGASAFIPKPFQMSTLENEIGKALAG